MDLGDYADIIHGTAAAHGFWDKERNLGEMLMLATSELSEALEADRSGEPPLWYAHEQDCLHYPLNQIKDLWPKREGCTCRTKPEGAAVEVGDCIIRCLDTIRGNWPDIDIDVLVQTKMAYNNRRPHKHGKAY